MSTTRARRISAVAALLLCAVGVPGLAGGGALRVCADPDNLPLSSSDPGEPGLYLELARLVAARLALRAEYVWWPTHVGPRALRETLLAGRCDVHFGLPHDKGFAGKRLALTRPFLDVGYVVVVPRAATVSGLDDLRAAPVGVQFGTPPQLLLAAREAFELVTFRRAEEVMEALGRGEVESAFAWGPTAGYYNKKKLGEAFQLVPVEGPGLQWQVAAGVRAGQDALRAGLDRALEELRPDIRGLADKYGFPPASLRRLRAAAPEAPSAPTLAHQSALVAPPTPDPALVPAGRSLFNQHCSHCHAPNAVNPDPGRDLRRLKLRYGPKMAEVFYATVTDGRPHKGMPPWKGTLSDDVIWRIFAFLWSVQSEP